MSSSVTGTQTMYGLGDLMGTCCPPEGESKPPLTAAEAAILVLAAFFLVSWGLLSWRRATGAESLPIWSAPSVVREAGRSARDGRAARDPLPELPDPWRRKKR